MPGIRSRRAALACLALTAAAACTDAPYEPAALLDAEVAAAIEVAAELPTLSRLVDAALPHVTREDAPALLRARALWLRAGGEADERRMAVLRERAYDVAAGPLAAALPAGAAEDARAALRDWLAAARTVRGATAIPELARALTVGARLLDDAEAFAREGRAARAMRATLEAADVLAATTPRNVALRLITLAERRMERSDRPGVGITATDVRRADRLVRGAREALDAGDFALAIRRAYYAGQLLD